MHHNSVNSPNVTLADENASMMVRLGESKLEHLRLETTFQKVLHFQAENVIELHARLIQHTDAHETTKKCISLEQALLVLLLEGEQLTGRLADLGERVLDSPDLALVAKSKLSDDSQLSIETRLLVGTTGRDERLRVDGWYSVIDHLES